MADKPQLDPEDVAALEEMAQWWRDREDGSGQSMTRRKMLGLLGGAGLGAAGVGGFFAGEASAGTDSVGQIGTQSEPADAVLEDVMDSGGNNPMSFPGDGSVSVDNADIGDVGHGPHPSGLDDRPVISNQDRTITVGTDTSTIQEAINQVPIYLRHDWTIDIPNGTYSEDLFIPPIIQERGDEAERVQLIIQGDKATPSNVQASSVYVSGVSGVSFPQIKGIEWTADNPFDNENVACAVYGNAGTVSFANCSFTSGPTNGLIAYAGQLRVGDTDFGGGNLQDGIKAKIQSHAYDTNNNTGNVTRFAYFPEDSGRVTYDSVNTSLSGDVALVNAGGAGAGLAYDSGTESIRGVKKSGRAFEPGGDLRLGTSGSYDTIDFTGGNTVNESADSMTSDPETSTEDGYIVVEINGSQYQVPVYNT